MTACVQVTWSPHNSWPGAWAKRERLFSDGRTLRDIVPEDVARRPLADQGLVQLVAHQDGTEFYSANGLVYQHPERITDYDMPGAERARAAFERWAFERGYDVHWEGP